MWSCKPLRILSIAFFLNFRQSVSEALKPCVGFILSRECGDKQESNAHPLSCIKHYSEILSMVNTKSASPLHSLFSIFNLFCLSANRFEIELTLWKNWNGNQICNAKWSNEGLRGGLKTSGCRKPYTVLGWRLRRAVLFSSDSEMFQFGFSAVHHLKISEQRWKRKLSELKISAVSSPISSVTTLIFDGFRMARVFSVIFPPALLTK